MAFDKLIKRHFRVVVLPLVGVAAFFDAQGIMQIVGVSLAADARHLAAPPLVARVAPGSASASPHATSAAAILHRNPFDSETGPLDAVPVAESAATDGEKPLDTSDPFDASDCEGVKVLLITTASSDPDWSFAVMETSKDKGKSVMRRRGGDVDGKTVTFVGWDRVWLASGNQLCQSQMFKPPAPASASGAPSAAPTPKGGASSLVEKLKKGIQTVNDHEFNIDRSVVDEILENQAELMRQAQIAPVQENGRTVGVRLLGIRPDTLLGLLGMANGDRIDSINGFDIANPEKALEAYARLRTADHLTFAINRNGQSENLDYNIK